MSSRSTVNTGTNRHAGSDTDATTTMKQNRTVETVQAGTDVSVDSADNVTDVMRSSSQTTVAFVSQSSGDIVWTWQMVLGVTCGSIVIAAIMVTAFIMFCYYRCHRRCCGSGSHDPFRFQNNSPQIWEDTVTLSYINAQFDLKDSSDEFASLENDTFLNSLESMMFHTSWSTRPNQNPGQTRL